MSAPSPGDSALIGAIAAGSEDAFRTLYRRWAPQLLGFLVRATGSREVGEDLLQEAFLRILRAAPQYKPLGRTGAWIYRICANLAYSYWRREGRCPARAVENFEGVAPQRNSPEARRVRRSFASDVRDALQDLPPNQRMVFVLKVDRGLTYVEIAEVLHCPEGTVKSRFHHAVRRLRAALREWSGGLGGERAPSAAEAARLLLSKSRGTAGAAQLGRRSRG